MLTSNYLYRTGRELDIFLNVTVLDGEEGETISRHAAKDSDAHKVWGCLLCKWLSLTVEKDHCPKTLAGNTISPRGGIIAGIQLLAVFLALTGLFWFAVLR